MVKKHSTMPPSPAKSQPKVVAESAPSALLTNLPAAPSMLTIGLNGYPFDQATGCYILGNGYRLYNPVMRAFYSPDNLSPFGEGGVSRYQYCCLDPINLSDPTGHASTWAIGGIILGALGIVLGIVIAIPTGGASLSLVAVGAGIIAGASGAAAIGTGVASLAYESSNPDYADKLGKISFSLGAFSVAVASVAAPVAPIGASLAGGNKLLVGLGGLTQLGGSVTAFAGAVTENDVLTKVGASVFGVGLAVSAIGISAPVLARVFPRAAPKLQGPLRSIHRGTGNTVRRQFYNTAMTPNKSRSQLPGLSDLGAAVSSRVPYPRMGM